MKMRRIEIAGFGKVCIPELTLAPGINLTYGMNESGKSTLHAALIALLYGFYEGNRATKDENETREYYRPWAGDSYGGALEYSLSNEKAYRIERKFTTSDIPSKVFDLTTGQDITGNFEGGRHGNLTIAKQHLGMSRSVFESSAYIGQGEVRRFHEAKGIGDTIASLADTAKLDVSAAKAIKSLDKVISEDVGSDRSRTTPLAVARRKLAECNEELGRYKSAKQGMEAAANEKDELVEKLRQAREDLEKVSFAIVCNQLDDVRRRIVELKKQGEMIIQAGAILEQLHPYAHFSLSLYEAVIRRRQSLELATESLRQCEKDFNARKAELDRTGMTTEYETLENSVGRITDSEYEELNAINKRCSEIDSEMEEDKRLLAELEKRSLSVKPWVLIIAVLFAPIGIPILLWYRHRIKREVETKKADIRLGLQPLENEQKTIRDKERTILAKFKLGSFDDLKAKRSRYFQIGLSLSECTSLRRQSETAREQITKVKNGTLDLYKEVGIIQTDFEKASTLFNEAYGAKVWYDEANRLLQLSETLRRQILGRQSPSELDDICRKLELQREKSLANNAFLDGLVFEGDLEKLKEEHEDLDKERENLEREISIRDERINTALSGHRIGAEIEEDLARYQGVVGRLELMRKCLEIARDSIEAAANDVHRNFAPILSKAASDSCAIITGSRYTGIYVDPTDLSINVKAPETGQIISARGLSSGAGDQLYLALRVELTRLMSNLHEIVPLFMDDPFVNFDRPRLIKVLDFLAGLSQTYQVLMFTKDERILEWFDSTLAGRGDHASFTMNFDGTITRRR